MLPGVTAEGEEAGLLPKALHSLVSFFWFGWGFCLFICLFLVGWFFVLNLSVLVF